MQGRWDEIVEEVQRAGVGATMEGASSEELIAVANAARYLRRWDLAREALHAERRRFANTARALDATYLLGRLEEARGQLPEAMSWYRGYLRRAPTGPYVSESLGRMMTLAREGGDPIEAKALADQYLRRFTEGSYAAAARAVLGLP